MGAIHSFVMSLAMHMADVRRLDPAACAWWSNDAPTLIEMGIGASLVLLCWMAVAKLTRGVAVREYERAGRKYMQIPGQGWLQGYHNAETGELDTWKTCDEPNGAGPPPLVKPGIGVKVKAARS